MEQQLKPCPFCGGEARVSVKKAESLWSRAVVPYTKVECGDCEIGTPFLCKGWEPTPQDAWNKRIAHKS